MSLRRLKCFFGAHRYGPWLKPYIATYFFTLDDLNNGKTKKLWAQERHCQRCGKVDGRGQIGRKVPYEELRNWGLVNG